MNERLPAAHPTALNASAAGAGRHRILFVLGSDIAFRNFVESGGLRDLVRRHDVWAIRLQGVQSVLTPDLGIREAGVVTARAWREAVRYHLSWISIFAGRSRARMMRAKATLIGGRGALLYSVLGSRALYPVTDTLAEALIGREPEVDRVLDSVNPDAIVLPYGGLNSFSLDVYKAARRRGIPSILLNYNWDNVVSKGLLRHAPDAFCVWGEDMARLAEQVYRFPAEAIAVIGAAHFEHYFDPQRVRAATKEAARLRTGVPRVLFAGSSRGHPEVPYLELLEQAIEDGRLPRLKVIYRPHPWRTPRQEKNFYDVAFRHVEMDPQLAARFTRETINRTWTHKEKMTLKPDLDYYPVLLQSVDAVISPLSTLALEAALVGRPLLAMATFHEKWLRDSLSSFEYLQRLMHDVPGVVTCENPATFVERMAAVMRLAGDPTLSARMQAATRPIVYRDGESTYGERLTSVVDAVLARRRRA